MSRQINTKKKLSATDEQYLRDRGRDDLVEFANNRKEFERRRNLTQEELAQLEHEANVEAAGKRTPSLMDNSLVEEQQGQREDLEADQLAANAAEYDPDDVTFVESCTVDELKRILKERREPTSGTKPQLQLRLLESLKKESEQKEAEQREADEEADDSDDSDEQQD